FPQEASECQIVFQRRWLDQSTTLVEDVDLRIATSTGPPKTVPGTEIRIEKLRTPVSQAEVRRIARSLIKQNVISNCASALRRSRLRIGAVRSRARKQAVGAQTMTSPCLEGPDRSRKAEEQACETIEKGDSASDDHRRTPRGAHSIRRTPGKPAPRQRKAFRPSRPQFRSRARLHQAPGEHRRRPLAAPRRYARQVARTKTMLAVHLENGAVTLRDVPVPERPAG